VFADFKTLMFRVSGIAITAVLLLFKQQFACLLSTEVILSGRCFCVGKIGDTSMHQFRGVCVY